MPEALRKNHTYVLKGQNSYLTKTSGGDCYRTPFYSWYQIPPGVHSTTAAQPLNAGWPRPQQHQPVVGLCILSPPPTVLPASQETEHEVTPFRPTVTYKQVIKLIQKHLFQALACKIEINDYYK